MDALFCYIHRQSKPVDELKILAGGQAEIGLQLSRIVTDYPDARLEIFRGEQLLTRLDTGDARDIERAAGMLAAAG